MRFKSFYLKEEVEPFDLEYMSSLKTYNHRLIYCRTKLKKLGVGSSREVFEIDSNWVIKVAKNDKGLAQNNVESDYSAIRMFDFLPKIKDNDDEDRWLIVENCEKITQKEFEKLTKISFKLFSQFLREYESIEIRRRKIMFSEEIHKMLDDEDSFVYGVRDLLGNFDMLPGDFEKINSFGKSANKIKIIDWGFTKNVHKTYYQK